MDMITPVEVIRRIQTYFDGGICRFLSPSQARHAARGVTATRHNPHEAEFAGPCVSGKKPTVLIQQASGWHVRLLDLSESRHRAYADRHGITLWSVRGPVQAERHPYWDKVVLIRRALAMGFELVVWLDADTLIVHPQTDLRSALGDGPPIGMCRHVVRWGKRPWHYNAGVIFVRNCTLARRFFQEAWEAGPTRDGGQDQTRINEVAGRRPEAVQTLSDAWNCTVGVNGCPSPVIQSWHGRGKDALESMAQAARSALAAKAWSAMSSLQDVKT
jgi:hypothetical protein